MERDLAEPKQTFAVAKRNPPSPWGEKMLHRALIVKNFEEVVRLGKEYRALAISSHFSQEPAGLGVATPSRRFRLRATSRPIQQPDGTSCFALATSQLPSGKKEHGVNRFNSRAQDGQHLPTYFLLETISHTT